jgi:hypothetical protein
MKDLSQRNLKVPSCASAVRVLSGAERGSPERSHGVFGSVGVIDNAEKYLRCQSLC